MPATSDAQPAPEPASREGTIASWSRVDPTGVLPAVVRLGSAVPGAATCDRIAAALERRWLRQLRTRMAELEPAAPPREAPIAPGEGAPASVLDGLLRRSLEQTATASRSELFTALLRQLVPDEARLLAALADGRPYPLVHVVVPGLPGSPGRPVLENATSAGRSAGVALPDMVPSYVGHLRQLGLAEEGPEDPLLQTEYELVLGEAVVTEARRRADEVSRLPPRILRRTLRCSELGAELWSACRPPAEESGS